MKKHLAAFLSMVGLAGTAAPVQAQVLKGSNQESKAESQIKQNKHKQETNAVQKVREAQITKGTAAGKAAKSEAATKRVLFGAAGAKSETATNTTQVQSKHPDKPAKAEAQRKSVQSDLQKKIVKTKTGVKGESQDQQSK